MADMELENIVQDEWVYVDDKQSTVDEQISEMENNSEEGLETEYKTLYSDEMSSNDCENNDLIVLQSSPEDLNSNSSWEFGLSDDISDPGFYDEFLPDIEITPPKKAYQHYRNKQINFYLDLLLALAVAAAVGLGTGHFWGWSHKCLEQENKFLPLPHNSHKMLLDESFEKNMIQADDTHLPNEHLESIKKEKESEHKIIYGTINFAKKTDNLNSGPTDDESYSLKQKNELTVRFYENIVGNEFPFVSKSESVEKVDNETFKETQGSHNDPNTNLNYNDLKSNDENNNMIMKDKFSVNEGRMVENLIEKMHASIHKVKYIKNALSIKLRKDLSDIIQSLRELVTVRITNSENLKIVDSIYDEFQIHIDKKISELETFESLSVSSTLQMRKNKATSKLINSLTHSIDKFFRASIKTITGGIHNFFKTDKFARKSQGIIEKLEMSWEKNKQFFNQKPDQRRDKDHHFKKFKHEKWHKVENKKLRWHYHKASA